MINVVHLTAPEWQRLRAIRLRALLDAPEAFGTTYEEAAVWQPERWSQQLRELPTFVVVREGLDVGMARSDRDATSAATAWLISMWVAPEARRTGVGSLLIDAIVEWARANSVDRLLLDVADGNATAIALYAAKGFSPNGEVGALPPPREHVREHQRERRL